VQSELAIRKAREEEIHWVNEQYQRIGFKLSDIAQDLIAIALIDGQKAGVGRVQPLTSVDAELGGMYVLPDFRGAGVASKLVEFLVAHAVEFERVHCLPFAHLAEFYKKFGFDTVNDRGHVPSSILAKHRWCNDTYEHDTLLFVKYNLNVTG